MVDRLPPMPCLGECDPATGGYTHRTDCPTATDTRHTTAAAGATLADRFLVAEAEYQLVLEQWCARPASSVRPGMSTFMLAAAQPAVVPSAPAADPTDGLTVQQADALWDAVAIPGPNPPSFPEQHARVCRAVAGMLAEATAAPEARPVDGAGSVREDLLRAVDFNYCVGALGYGSPEALLDAYDASRTAVPSVPADAERRERES